MEARRERFVFPDGTTFDIIAFAPPQTRAHETTILRARPPARCDGAKPREAAPPAEGAPVSHAPSACAVCGGAFVYPVDWARNRDGDWNVRLRCPECEAQRLIVLGREGVEDLNRTLYLRAQAMAREADQLSRRNFEEEAAKLVWALSLDLILPMDF
jgi:hypothetical protein